MAPPSAPLLDPFHGTQPHPHPFAAPLLLLLLLHGIPLGKTKWRMAGVANGAPGPPLPKPYPPENDLS